MAWNGLFAALWTPTDTAGRLLRTELSSQVRFLRGAGLDGLMVLGSTGEFVHLEVSARKEVLRLVTELEPDWPVIANCSHLDPHAMASLGQHARQVGANAIALLPPWFFSVAPRDAAEFLIRGAEASGLPLVIYNYPERTGHRLSLETVAAVCDRVAVAALKQSGAEFDYHRELGQLAREKDFVLITGADTRVADAFQYGARGVVSGLANALPEPLLTVFRSVQAGDFARAEQANRPLQQWIVCLKGLEFPLDVAAAMLARGRPIGDWKQTLSAATLNQIHLAADRGRSLLETLNLTA